VQPCHQSGGAHTRYQASQTCPDSSFHTTPGRSAGIGHRRSSKLCSLWTGTGACTAGQNRHHTISMSALDDLAWLFLSLNSHESLQQLDTLGTHNCVKTVQDTVTLQVSITLHMHAVSSCRRTSNRVPPALRTLLLRVKLVAHSISTEQRYSGSLGDSVCLKSQSANV